MSQDEQESPPERRQFLHTVGKVAMVGGLAASYGTCAAYGGRFLYPAKDEDTAWQFVIELTRFPKGQALEFRAPNGAPINIARREDSGAVTDFVALSSTCPHLGCQVHWQAEQNRFFCPCHNGVFSPTGKATAGPPAEAGQSLSRYPLKVENGLLYILVAIAPAETAMMAPEDWREGHDPCLKMRPPAGDGNGQDGNDQHGNGGRGIG